MPKKAVTCKVGLLDNQSINWNVVPNVSYGATILLDRTVDLNTAVLKLFI